MKAHILPLVLVLAACSQGNGRDESRTYPLQGFDSVSAEAGIELILRQGPFAVEAQSRNGDLSRLNVAVHGTELDVSSQPMISFGRSPSYTVTVTAPKWTAIKASAGVKVDGEDLQLEDITVNGSAGVRIRLSGTCRQITADASAGAAIEAGDLKCATADATASAGAKIAAYATDKARGKASAGALVEFSGNPATIEKEAAIGGVVNVK